MPSYVVTGVSRGIGREFVNQLTQDQNNVVFGLARNPENAPKLLELQKARPNLHIIKADLVDLPSLKAAAAEVEKVTGGSLDYLINNAAQAFNERSGLTLATYPDEELLEADLIDLFRVNVVGVVHTINAFLPLLRKGSAKKVISISTGVADNDLLLQTGFLIQAPYCISKAALNTAVAKYAAELRDEGFTFLALSPGLVNTAEKPPTPEELERFNKMVAQFKKYAPHWDGKPITPETSVRLMLGVIERSSVKDTGAFLSHWGNQQWL
ncbi:short-chain dehydrogenases/reductase [Trametes coccinea BRFM310]|uniref:Short-chain dehydrogenases/reductase n=1 Tax=Trametes coccinea (strain BRFM310) TaxID=1353009 RepID=A0A1Y2IK73_TRAC3|nr:short-chain dehydrogenases/reductase [Trametes coccinea BRFM310]